MKNIRFVLFFLVCSFIFSCKQAPKDPALELYSEISESKTPNTLTDKEKQLGWQLLFDGKTENGWHGFNQTGFPNVWSIEDGTLTNNAVGGGEEEGDLITNKIYKNFAFAVEYKLEKGTNSGIIYQFKEDTIYKYPYQSGPEFQIIDHENWPDKLEDWQIHGANYAMYPPMRKPYKPLGEWNRLMLIVKGNNVIQIVNGEITARFEKYSEEWTKLRNSGKWADFPDYGKYDEGPIALQNHGTRIWFRDIKIKEL